MVEQEQDWADNLADEILSLRGQAGKAFIAATIRMTHVEVRRGIENDIWDQVVRACGGGNWSESPTELITAIIDERDDLRETVGKFVHTEDSVPITEGMVTYCSDATPFPHQWKMRDKRGNTVKQHCEKQYSTIVAAREAAARAAGGS